jgi:[ribosomal protein S5]-alanine N-acetyltransferase
MLETTRLKLVPLTHAQLQLYKNDPPALAMDLGVKYEVRQNDPAVAKDLEEAIEFWLGKTQTYSQAYEWYTNWEILLKHEGLAIGGIGFAGLPDDDGKSMVGYGLDIRYHSQGYATEALQALVSWGFAHDTLKAIVADTPVGNIPSHRVLIKNKFNEYSRDQELIHWRLNRC